MALTAAQKTDVRRYAGYPMLGDVPADDNSDMAYSWVSPGVMQTLEHRLNSMSAEEEAVLINKYLVKLALLETAVTDSVDNLDTAKAAVWERNSKEVVDKRDLFDDWRRRMCAFVGVDPGPSLGDGGISIERC